MVPSVVAGGMVIRLQTWIAVALLALSPPQQQPRRIVSTFPSVTETLFALGAGDRVVGVSSYCRYPPAVLALPKVGTYAKPDPEKIALLRPDLVIIQQNATTLADRLRALAIPYTQVKLGSLDEIYSLILDVGHAVGLPDRAEKLTAGIQSKLADIRTKTRGEPHPRVLIILGRNPGDLTNLVAVGPGSYLAELLEIAGGINVMAGTTIAYPRISLETVVRLNPDVILDASMMDRAGDESGGPEQHLREPWLAHRELAAVQNGMVLGLASETLVTPGPRVVDAVELLHTKIHPAERRP